MIWTPHVTVAAIAENDGKFLIVEEKVDGQMVYNQPAGHLDSGESLIEAVIRETLEETAWTFQPEALVGIQLWRHPVHSESYLRFSFCGSCYEHNTNRPLDDGIEDVVWLSRDELMDNNHRLRSPMVLRSIDDYLEGRRYSLDILEHIASDTGI
ncbi:MAG: NUDIX hydrolase [Gammaproteobacteria bacterium]|nr:NUDIX hydrolase [Gammaproteobacteria bacterium]